MYRHRTRTLFLFTCAVRVVVACLAALPCLASPCFASPAPEPRFRVLQPARHDSSPAARLHLAAHGPRSCPWPRTHASGALAVDAPYACCCGLLLASRPLCFCSSRFLAPHRIASPRRAASCLATHPSLRFARPYLGMRVSPLASTSTEAQWKGGRACCSCLSWTVMHFLTLRPARIVLVSLSLPPKVWVGVGGGVFLSLSAGCWLRCRPDPPNICCSIFSIRPARFSLHTRSRSVHPPRTLRPMPNKRILASILLRPHPLHSHL